MVKKVLGVLFIVGALLMLIGSIANGSLFSDMGSVVVTYGNFLGMLFPIVLYVLSGIFLITFDNPTKLNYIEGFKKRSKQSTKCILFFIAYIVLMHFSAIGVVLSVPINYWVAYVIAIIPYAIPSFIFIYCFEKYCIPNNASKKYFADSDSALNEYLSVNETFYTWSEDNFVLSSYKVLYFPALFCVIPFNQIASLKPYKQLGEKGVYINLVNGKKICIATKHVERIQDAVNAIQQTQ